MQFQLEETLPSKQHETSDEPQPVRTSSAAIRTLLQHILLNPDGGEDSMADSNGEHEGTSDSYNEEVEDQGGNGYCGIDDSDEVVEVKALKKVDKVAPQAHGCQAKVKVVSEDESDDENGESNYVWYSLV